MRRVHHMPRDNRRRMLASHNADIPAGQAALPGHSLGMHQRHSQPYAAPNMKKKKKKDMPMPASCPYTRRRDAKRRRLMRRAPERRTRWRRRRWYIDMSAAACSISSRHVDISRHAVCRADMRQHASAEILQPQREACAQRKYCRTPARTRPLICRHVFRFHAIIFYARRCRQFHIPRPPPFHADAVTRPPTVCSTSATFTAHSERHGAKVVAAAA